jgi:predicted Rossmann fold nucleotide-binding protein DprA/Smf involved in DNA uptake
MSSVAELLSEATNKLRSEAARVEKLIADKERELEPLRLQLADLQAAIARVEGRPATGSPLGSRAPRGHNRKLILEFLQSNPDAKARTIAEATGIASATTYATLAKLVQDGRVSKRSKGGNVVFRVTK